MSYQASDNTTDNLTQDQTNTFSQDASTNASGVDESSVPNTAKDVPLTGVTPGENVSFKEQVQGNAKMFAGKVFGNDEEARQGAERVLGLEDEQQNQ